MGRKNFCVSYIGGVFLEAKSVCVCVCGCFFGSGDGMGGGRRTYGYLSRASDMMEREYRHCACTFRSLSVGTSS